jgi:hypothetical protein
MVHGSEWINCICLFVLFIYDFLAQNVLYTGVLLYDGKIKMRFFNICLCAASAPITVTEHGVAFGTPASCQSCFGMKPTPWEKRH